MPIPSAYHFILFRPDDATRQQPFSLIQYLAIASCVQMNRPPILNFHCDQEPWGAWWELARQHVNVVRMQPPHEVNGIALQHAAHRSDIARLRLLLEHGGIYLDLDVMCLRPFAPLQTAAVVMGKESGEGLCNAVILAERGTPFLRRWLDCYSTFNADKWNEHSVVLPKKLAHSFPGEITVMDERSFFWPMHWNEHLDLFFRGAGSSFSRDSYCVHLWASLSRAYLDEITPHNIWERQSEFCLLARRFLPREFAYGAR